MKTKKKKVVRLSDVDHFTLDRIGLDFWVQLSEAQRDVLMMIFQGPNPPSHISVMTMYNFVVAFNKGDKTIRKAVRYFFHKRVMQALDQLDDNIPVKSGFML